MPGQTRDRIVEFRRIAASQLRPHPSNWRRHSASQAEALRAVLDDVGWAGALVARRLPDGGYELIDGHLRAETCRDEELPVLVVDLSDDEAGRLLATFDPLTTMAEADAERLAALASTLRCESEALASLVEQTLDQAARHLEAGDHLAAPLRPARRPRPALDTSDASNAEAELPASYQVVVECRNEAHQRALFERFESEGLKCRLLTL